MRIQSINTAAATHAHTHSENPMFRLAFMVDFPSIHSVFFRLSILPFILVQCNLFFPVYIFLLVRSCHSCVQRWNFLIEVQTYFATFVLRWNQHRGTFAGYLQCLNGFFVVIRTFFVGVVVAFCFQSCVLFKLPVESPRDSSTRTLAQIEYIH